MRVVFFLQGRNAPATRARGFTIARVVAAYSLAAVLSRYPEVLARAGVDARVPEAS